MKSPALTIIIPTYNAVQTISICLQSIVNQSFQDFEILILDGLSSDNTVSVVNEFADKSSNIRILSESDNGIYDAMNKGIVLARGTWLYFLGADDKLYDNNILSTVFTTIENDKTLDIVYGNVLSERFNGIYNGEYNNKKIMQNNICHQAIFFSKSIFAVFGDFNLKYKAQADWDHNLKWFLNHDIKRKYIDVVIAYYADGGFSSVNGDDVFNFDKRLNYVRYGEKSLSWFSKSIVIQIDFLKALKRWDVKKMKLLLRRFRI